MTTTTKILLIEDNRNLADALTSALHDTAVIEIAATGKQGLYKNDADNYAAIILDLNLPDVPGRAVCQQLRERGFTAPILILSGEDSVMSKITMLDAGANDYLTKPVSLGELKARIRCLLRAKPNAVISRNSIELGGIVLDSLTHQVSRDDITIPLRRKEYAMLECLMSNPGGVVSRKALTRYAWNGTEDNWTNTVDVHIKHLRDKIDRPFGTNLIKTVHGIGYRFDPVPKVALATEEQLA